MIKLIDLNHYLANFLQIDAFNDYCPNGLQVNGREEINKIVTGVTACQALLNRAVDEKADAILVHHGYFWKNENPCIIGPKYTRLKTLLNNGISLFAYHLPLDAHTELGNNVQLAKLLDITIQGEILNPMGKNILLHGKFAKPLSAKELQDHLSLQLQRDPLYISAHQRPIKTVAWCTGGGQDFIELAASQGVDAFITGEASERTVHLARELGIDFFAAGHHATERYGIQALGDCLANQFAVTVQFIDIDNPV